MGGGGKKSGRSQESCLTHRAVLSEERYITACKALSRCDNDKQTIQTS